MNGRPAFVLLLGVFATVMSTGSMAAQSAQPLPVSEQPLPAEKNPPGDIPDTQVFIEYHSPHGLLLRVPEGWARSESGDKVVFSDKYNTVVLVRSKRTQPISVGSIKAHEVVDLERRGKAIRVSHVSAKRLPGGNAVAVSYGSNSDVNPVTNKAIRLENLRYYFWKNGELVTLTLSAPYGADNADQWHLMARSFRWR